MDFNNGLYVFNGVPGLEASKGERIAKALQKLQTKIKHLEQVRNSERGTSSKNGSTDTQDITLSDVQLKLLFLQLQYLRVNLRNTRQDREESTAVAIEHEHQSSESVYHEMENCCKETQTGMSLHEHISLTIPKSAASLTQETHTCTTSQQTVPVNEATSSNFNAVNSCDEGQCTVSNETMLPSTNDVQMHYRLKIKDVPFIIGASAFDSHNVIANVQNIIAKMKTHKKALCGSRVQASHKSASSLEEKSDSQENARMMKEISKGLTELQIKQAGLIQKIDNQNTNPLAGNQENIKQTTEPLKTNSTISGATAALHSKEKRQLKSTRAIKKNKHVVPTNKIRANLPQIARQRFLRSIRETKKKLSEEDISWV